MLFKAVARLTPQDRRFLEWLLLLMLEAFCLLLLSSSFVLSPLQLQFLIVLILIHELRLVLLPPAASLEGVGSTCCIKSTVGYRYEARVSLAGAVRLTILHAVSSRPPLPAALALSCTIKSCDII